MSVTTVTQNPAIRRDTNFLSFLGKLIWNYKVISHFPPFGPVNTHWTCCIESSVQLGASFKPLHSLKSSAPASRSSIIAR